MVVTDQQLNQWANPPSESESERCENAIAQVSDALRTHFGDSISFIRQGSHKNRTNIRIDSDVDIAVIHDASCFSGVHQLTEQDKALYEANRVSASYTFSQFKNEVHTVLAKQFGAAAVERKNKCIRVLGNTNRVNADVVPAFEFLRYGAYNVVEAKGIAFNPDSGGRIESFPVQHYDSGVRKNETTHKAFKPAVRLLKNVRNALVDKGNIEKDLVSSFFLECLVWNAPAEYFTGQTYRDDAVALTAKIWNDMRAPSISNDYAEVSDLRWLFRGGQRDPAKAEKFALHAWRYVQP